MKRNWNEEELMKFFNLLLNDVDLAMKNKTDVNRLGFPVFFKYFQYKAGFQNQKQDIPSVVLTYIAKQLHLSPDLFHQYSWGGKEKTYIRHRQQIRSIFGFRTLTEQANERLKQWLNEQVRFTHDTDSLEMKSYIQFYHFLYSSFLFVKKQTFV